MKQVFDFNKFSKALKYRRIIEDNIELRAAAKEIGTSAATLSRCENQKMPDVITYANICKWLGVSMDTFISKAKKIQ